MTAEALEYSVHLRRPHPMQEQFLNSPAKRIVIRAGRVVGRKVLGGEIQLRHLLDRTLGFDLALLQERESLLVQLVLITGVPTTLEVFILVVPGLLHHQQATRCSTLVGYRRATSR